MLFFRAEAQAPNFQAEAQAPKVINNNTNIMTAEQLISQARATNATVLDLGDCGLTQIPDLSGLPYLTTLNLGTWYYEYYTSTNQWEYKKTQNKGEKNQLTDLTGIEVLASSLLNLSFEDNKVRDIRPLEKLTALTNLIFFSNQVSDIRPVEKLTNLTNLYFYSNQVSDIRPLEKLTALTNLDFSRNKVSDISPLEKLTALTNLDFSNNKVSDIRPVEKLIALRELYFSRNKVSDISPLEKLIALTQLYFSSNQVSDIRPLEKLTALTQLNFFDNKVSDISPLEKLTALTYLDFSSNQVINIRPFRPLFPHLRYLSIQGNPIEKLPKDIYEKENSIEDVRRYFEAIAKGKTEIRKECKMILVGYGDVGKTSILYKLQNTAYRVQDVPKDNRTRGIDIVPWTYTLTTGEKQRVNVWDFGGQNMYNATHQFFLTHKALYLFVWQARENLEQAGFHY
jgi:internalin A